MNKKRVLIWTAIALTSLIFLASFIAAILNGSSFVESGVNKQIERYGIGAIFVFSFLTEFLPQYISPHLALVNGALFGFNPLSVILATIIGSILGSVLGFWLGRKYGIHLSYELAGKKKILKVEKFMNLWGGKTFVVVAAASPLPYIPLVLGSLKMSWRNFIIFGVVPRTIGLLLTALIYFVL